MAPLIEWHDHLSIGIPALDEQHRELAELVNLLASHVGAAEDAGTDGSGWRKARTVLDRLHRHTQAHFHYEEELMVSAGYTDLALHSREHVMLLGELRAVTARLITGREALNYEILQALKEWLIAHIVGSDREFAVFFHGRGAMEPVDD